MEEINIEALLAAVFIPGYVYNGGAEEGRTQHVKRHKITTELNINADGCV